MNLKTNVLHFTIVLLISACGSPATDQPSGTAVDETEMQDTLTGENTPEKTLTPLEQALKRFADRKAETLRELAEATPEQANVLYETLEKQQKKDIEKISKILSKTLDNYALYNGETDPNQAERKAQAELLKKVGLEFWEIGEGFTEIRVAPHYYERLAASYVTPDYKLYLKLSAMDAEQLYQADAGLVIPMEEVGQRAIRWENFLQKYPKSKKYKEALELTRMYQIDFLFGMDNTPTHDFEPLQLTEESGLKIDELIRKYPSSKTAALCKTMYELEGFEFYTKVERIRQEQDRIMGKP